MIVKMSLVLLLTVFFGVVFFGATDPKDLPVGLLMVPVLLVFTAGFLFASIFMRLFFFSKPSTKHRSVAVVFAVGLTLILLFQSSGGIVWGDILLLGLLMLISYIYINKF